MRAITAIALVIFAVLVACDAPGEPADPGQSFVQVDGPDVLTADDLCKGIADPCGDEGARECVQGGFRECVEVGGCLQWGFRQACVPGTFCDAGACVAGCAGQECTIAGARKCGGADPSEVLVCDDHDGDGCLEWGGSFQCEGDQVCASGGVCGSVCKDECAAGFVKCEGAAVVTCAEHDGDGCVEWGGAQPCAAACSAGQCVNTCEDECAASGVRTCDGIGFKECQRGGDGCLHWGTVRACAPGSTCSAGECAVACSDECASAGATACEAGGVTTCGDWDDDPCREWSLPAPCAQGTSCSDGACAVSCVDECTTAGAMGCDPAGLGVRRCDDHDADPCLEWALVEQCDLSAGETCSLGACATACVDECEATAIRCRPGSTTQIERCGDGDPDPCSEWIFLKDCASDAQVCADGACAATCEDDCQVASCDGAGVAVPCGDFDADSCLDWGTGVPCQPWEICEGGSCVPQSAPSEVKISELLYNAPGIDTDVFIELHGPAGASLVGYTLVAINGGSGAPYALIELQGQLDSQGWFVIAHPDAAPWIADLADQLDPAADLQNSPDSVALHFGPQVVDAVGYGHFGPHDQFDGEGSPAPDVAIGHSLTRDGQVSDSDDNAADFADCASPTPGRSPAVAAPPSAWGQVRITEVMANPSVVADPGGEWFELHNPSATASYTLEGCVISDEDSDSYTIDGPLELPPGAFVTLARSADPGFTPDYTYTSVSMANGGDEVVLTCGGVEIDATAWTGDAPDGQTLSLDPSALSQPVSGEGVWCPGTSSYNGDRGTPGAPNPPCPSSGSFDQTVAEGPIGICNILSDWNDFTFSGAQAAATEGALRFEWLVAWCAGFGGQAEIWVELRTGTSWTEVAHRTAGGDTESCVWLFESLTVPQDTLTAARDASGEIHGRFRIVSGCGPGILCGVLGQTFPTNCARNIRLSYEH